MFLGPKWPEFKQKETDQSAHLCSLISAFIARYSDSMKGKVAEAAFLTTWL